MKKIATLLAAMAFAGSANATIYSYDFTATVYSIDEMKNSVYHGVRSYSLAGELISVGRVIHGRFTYDTDTPRDPTDIGGGSSASDNKTYAGALNQNIVTADVGLPRAQVTPDALFPNHIVVSNNQIIDTWPMPITKIDTFSVYESGSTSYGHEERGVSLTDFSGTTLNSSDLSGPLNTSAFDSGGFWYSLMDSNMKNGVMVQAQVDSVTAVPTPVPEPTTYAMLGAGLALLAWRKKARA